MLSTIDVGADAALVVGQIQDCQGELLAAESSLISKATPARIREIRAGRTAGRYALRRLQAEAGPIMAGDSGEPVWTSSVCGSISHSSRYVAVLVARLSRYKSVGLDIVDERLLGPEALDSVVTADEFTKLRQIEGGIDSSNAERIAFSAKEAVFKCQFPLTKNSGLSFLDVRLVVNARGALRVEAADGSNRKLTQLLLNISLNIIYYQSLTIITAITPVDGG